MNVMRVLTGTTGSIKDINTHCLQQFNAHWECLENNNHRLWECRKNEMTLNQCVFDKLVRFPVHWLSLPLCMQIQLSLSISRNHSNYQQGLKKSIPGAPENQTPVHLRPKQLYAGFPGPQY